MLNKSIKSTNILQKVRKGAKTQYSLFLSFSLFLSISPFPPPLLVMVPDYPIPMLLQRVIFERHFLDIYTRYLTNLPFVRLLWEVLLKDSRFSKAVHSLEKVCFFSLSCLFLCFFCLFFLFVFFSLLMVALSFLFSSPPTLFFLNLFIFSLPFSFKGSKSRSKKTFEQLLFEVPVDHLKSLHSLLTPTALPSSLSSSNEVFCCFVLFSLTIYIFLWHSDQLLF